MTHYNQLVATCNDGGLPALAGGHPSIASLALGNITTLQSASNFDLEQRRVSRFLLQAVISEMLPDERISNCLRLIVPGKDHVKVLYSEKVKRAHYGNLIVCGSVWGCPVCSAKITERKRIEVEPAISNWSGSVAMGAFTAQHDCFQSLQTIKGLLYDAFTKMQEGRAFQKIKSKYGIAGLIGSSEVTWGRANGWHPHKHTLVFFWEKLDQTDIHEFETVISENFRSKIDNAGGYAHPDYSVKFTLGNGSEEKNYVYKWGLDYELTKSPVKRARGENFSPFELARWSMNGEYLPVKLFREYYKAYKGTHQLSYSRGLRELLGLNSEKTDLEIAQEQDKEAVVLAEIARHVWATICKNNCRGQLIEVASSGDPELLSRYIEEIMPFWTTESH